MLFPVRTPRLVPFAFLIAALVGPPQLTAQQTSQAAILIGVDASVNSRDANLLGYTVTEHYAVFRGHDLVHPDAEMVVKTTYQKNSGKTYTILSESGSDLIRKQVLERILDNERVMTQPANRAGSVITSANYNMAVKGTATIDGRSCTVIDLTPRRSSPYLFKGTLWVDAQNQAIVQLQGIASKSPSMLTGATQVSRQYAQVNGLPMATHATAVSNSWLLGQTTVKIDYSGYEMTLAQPR